MNRSFNDFLVTDSKGDNYDDNQQKKKKHKNTHTHTQKKKKENMEDREDDKGRIAREITK